MTNTNDKQGSHGYTSAVFGDGLIVQTHSCPLITNDGVPIGNLNISIKQCVTRQKEGAACASDCSPYKTAVLNLKK